MRLADEILLYLLKVLYQVIATLKPEKRKEPYPHNDVFGDEFLFNEILNKTYWKELYDLSIEIRDIEAEYEWDGEKKQVIWNDVCFNPLSAMVSKI